MLRLLTRLEDTGAPAPCLTTAPLRRGVSRRLAELAPGIWISQFSQWQPASALDVHAQLPLATEAVEAPKRVFPWPAWHERAACREVGEEMFFGADPDERPTLRLSELAKARAICAQCPVVRTCLDWALTKPERFGVWAGTSGRQRDRMWLQLEAGDELEAVMSTWLRRLTA